MTAFFLGRNLLSELLLSFFDEDFLKKITKKIQYISFIILEGIR